MSACAICESDNQDDFEYWGQQALSGVVSWRTAATNAGTKNHMGLKNHMDKHYVSEVESQAANLDAELATAIEDGVRELLERAAVAPGDVRPLLLAAAKNLSGLADTKPSQQHLISALKVTQELTGMKQEQRFLLQFAAAAFPRKVEATSLPVIEIEAVADDDAA